ncbi:MAG: hypothetical protein JXR48_18615 [Candidatus Delongbacteria bacterium]|nr:hypothetical protein [Candidatus Delongbacteria bacterium]MBN2836974.1 hypothetical protein [Candidatus Delongbacteria bacterium]
MGLSIDLTKSSSNNKSQILELPSKIIALISFVIGIISFVKNGFSIETLTFILFTVWYALLFFDISIPKLLGLDKAFIKIDETFINFKLSIFSKPVIIDWSDVKEMNLELFAVNFKFHNNSEKRIVLEVLLDDDLVKVKNTLKEICKSKNIS